jgi:hypothetical protein
MKLKDKLEGNFTETSTQYHRKIATLPWLNDKTHKNKFIREMTVIRFATIYISFNLGRILRLLAKSFEL